MASSNVVSVVEAGTSRTVVLVGRARPGGGPPEVLGVGVHPTTGMRKGCVENANYVASAVRKALAAASGKDAARASIEDVSLICSCGDVAAEPLRQEVAIEGPDGVVDENAVEEVRARLDRSPPPEGREALETLRLYHTIDDAPGEVREPVGIPASCLVAHGLLLHTAESLAMRLEETVEEAGCSVNDVIFSGLAAAHGALTPQQREDGALCIDFGGGTTSWCAFANRHAIAAGALPVGGDHVTNDLLSAFRPGSRQAAERFKLAYGCADLRAVPAEGRVPLQPDGGDSSRTVGARAAAEVVHARMEELVLLIREDLKARGALSHLGAGIVVTGGGSLLRGVPELVSRVFGAPCQRPSLSTGRRELDADPALFATAWGGLRQAVRKDLFESERAAREGGALRRFFGMLVRKGGGRP